MEPMTLKGICAELKIEPRVAREKLRTAIREPKKYPTCRRRTNRVSRGNGGRDHPPKRKLVPRSLSNLRSSHSIEEFTCTAIFITIRALAFRPAKAIDFHRARLRRCDQALTP